LKTEARRPEKSIDVIEEFIMSTLIDLGLVTKRTKGATICGRVIEGVCANFNGVLYRTYVYVDAPCNPTQC
jgi:hypothetical protein